MAHMRKTLPTVVALSLQAATLTAQDVLPRVDPVAAGLASEPLAEVTRLLEETVAGGTLAGAVVGVARGGRVGYLEAVGAQDMESGAAMTERSLFRIYSMTKAVTAVAVMMLEEEGRFELSDPVAGYLSDFERVVVLQPDGSTRPPARPPTIEDLLLHTAGLSHRSSREYQEARVRSRDITLEQLVDNVVAVPLRADPGAEYRYSASPTVLGRLVEVVSGQPFDVFVEERILGPLGMGDTGFWVEPADRDRLTTVYERSQQGLSAYEIEEVPFTARPALMEGAVGLVSTVPDFLRFSQMLLDGGELGGVRLLQEGTVARMVRNGLPDEILRTRRGGTGWALANVAVVVDAAAAEGGAREGEYRWDGSAGTEFWVDPSTETVVVTMWQSSPANPGALRQRIRTLVRQAVEDDSR
jgi:CubicO group peptidase (beta-lactamase class C family)